MPFALPSILTRLAAPLRQHPHRTILAVIVLVASITIASEAFTGNLSNLASTFRTDLGPTGYTELAFASPNTLPVQLTRDGGVSFRFTVHNMQGNTTTYPFTVFSEINGSQKNQLAVGQITLQNGQGITKQETVHITQTGFTQRIFVSLPQQQQNINFWIRGAEQ